MPTVETTIKLSALEATSGEAVCRAGRDLLVAASQAPLVGDEDAQQAAVFEHGEVLPCDPPSGRSSSPRSTTAPSGLRRRLTRALHAGRGQEILRLVRTAKVMGTGGHPRVEQLPGDAQANAHSFYGADQLRSRLSPEARLVAVHGSGAVEKRIARHHQRTG